MTPIPSLALYFILQSDMRTRAATSAGSTEKSVCRIASSADGRSPFSSIKRAYGSSSSSSSSSLNEFFEPTPFAPPRLAAAPRRLRRSTWSKELARECPARAVARVDLTAV